MSFSYTNLRTGIVNSIRKSSPSGGFIKKDPNLNNRWISMSDESAREKVGHCLRDMIANKREEARTSSSKASSNAEEKIRSLALQNQKSIFPISVGPGQVSMPMPAVHPNFVPRPAPSTAKRATKKSPKTSPKRTKSIVSGNGSSSAARMAHHGGTAVEMPRITSTFNNFDYTAVTKGGNQEMTVQQRRILQLLESGFKGSVEDVIRAVM